MRNSNGFSGRKQVISKKKKKYKRLYWNSKGFSGQNLKFKQFFQKKKKKKGLQPQNVTKSGVSPQKIQKYRWHTPIWASICTPVAPSLLISSGKSPRLGGNNFHLGGAQPVNWGGTTPFCPHVAPGLICYEYVGFISVRLFSLNFSIATYSQLHRHLLVLSQGGYKLLIIIAILQ